MMINTNLVPQEVWDEVPTGDESFDFKEMLDRIFPKNSKLQSMTLDGELIESLEFITDKPYRYVKGFRGFNEKGRAEDKPTIQLRRDSDPHQFGWGVSIGISFEPSDLGQIWESIAALYNELYELGRYNDPEEEDDHMVSLSFEVTMNNRECTICHFLDDSTR